MEPTAFQTAYAEALMKRLRELAPGRAEIFDDTGTATVKRVETALAVFMEKYLWNCPCGARHELAVKSNLEAPIPNPPVTIHDDEGQSVAGCPVCGEELDLATLVPMLRWNVAFAGVFVVVDEAGVARSADNLPASGPGRYRPFDDPAEAVAAATRAMRRDPDELVQVIPEAVEAP